MRRELLPMLKLAGPVILAEIGWMSMGIVDTIMVGPLGPAAIGASGMSNSLFFAVAVFGMGVMLGLDALVATSDLIVEASTQAHLQEIAPKALGAGRDLVVLSCGGLLGREDWIALAEANGARIRVPSGAIAGLDGIKSAAVGEIAHVTHTTRKPPQGLEGAPYLVERGISLAGLQEEKEVFAGSAREACRGFPANVNVMAAVSLAGIGPDRTQARIVAVPGLKRNCHDIDVEGEFGRLLVHIENVPSENPKTGKLTALSIVRAVQDVVDPVRVGN